MTPTIVVSRRTQPCTLTKETGKIGILVNPYLEGAGKLSPGLRATVRKTNVA
jgi:hypothetical protein